MTVLSKSDIQRLAAKKRAAIKASINNEDDTFESLPLVQSVTPSTEEDALESLPIIGATGSAQQVQQPEKDKLAEESKLKQEELKKKIDEEKPLWSTFKGNLFHTIDQVQRSEYLKYATDASDNVSDWRDTLGSVWRQSEQFFDNMARTPEEAEKYSKMTNAEYFAQRIKDQENEISEDLKLIADKYKPGTILSEEDEGMYSFFAKSLPELVGGSASSLLPMAAAAGVTVAATALGATAIPAFLVGAAAAAVTRIPESMSEAGSTYEEVMQEAQSAQNADGTRKYSDAEAKEMARQASNSTFNYQIPLAVLDATQAAVLGKVAKGALVSSFSKKAATYVASSGARTAAAGLAGVAVNTIPEGLEEGYQYYASQKSKADAFGRSGPSLSELYHDEGFQESMMAGFKMGGIFGMLGLGAGAIHKKMAKLTSEQNYKDYATATEEQMYHRMIANGKAPELKGWVNRWATKHPEKFSTSLDPEIRAQEIKEQKAEIFEKIDARAKIYESLSNVKNSKTKKALYDNEVTIKGLEDLVKKSTGIAAAKKKVEFAEYYHQALTQYNEALVAFDADKKNPETIQKLNEAKFALEANKEAYATVVNPNDVIDISDTTEGTATPKAVETVLPKLDDKVLEVVAPEMVEETTKTATTEPVAQSANAATIEDTSSAVDFTTKEQEEEATVKKYTLRAAAEAKKEALATIKKASPRGDNENSYMDTTEDLEEAFKVSDENRSEAQVKFQTSSAGQKLAFATIKDGFLYQEQSSATVKEKEADGTVNEKTVDRKEKRQPVYELEDKDGNQYLVSIPNVSVYTPKITDTVTGEEKKGQSRVNGSVYLIPYTKDEDGKIAVDNGNVVMFYGNNQKATNQQLLFEDIIDRPEFTKLGLKPVKTNHKLTEKKDSQPVETKKPEAKKEESTSKPKTEAEVKKVAREKTKKAKQPKAKKEKAPKKAAQAELFTEEKQEVSEPAKKATEVVPVPTELYVHKGMVFEYEGRVDDEFIFTEYKAEGKKGTQLTLEQADLNEDFLIPIGKFKIEDITNQSKDDTKFSLLSRIMSKMLPGDKPVRGIVIANKDSFISVKVGDVVFDTAVRDENLNSSQRDLIGKEVELKLSRATDFNPIHPVVMLDGKPMFRFKSGYYPATIDLVNTETKEPYDIRIRATDDEKYFENDSLVKWDKLEKRVDKVEKAKIKKWLENLSDKIDAQIKKNAQQQKDSKIAKGTSGIFNMGAALSPKELRHNILVAVEGLLKAAKLIVKAAKSIEEAIDKINDEISKVKGTIDFKLKVKEELLNTLGIEEQDTDIDDDIDQNFTDDAQKFAFFSNKIRAYFDRVGLDYELSILRLNSFAKGYNDSGKSLVDYYFGEGSELHPEIAKAIGPNSKNPITLEKLVSLQAWTQSLNFETYVGYNSGKNGYYKNVRNKTKAQRSLNKRLAEQMKANEAYLKANQERPHFEDTHRTRDSKKSNYISLLEEYKDLRAKKMTKLDNLVQTNSKARELVAKFNTLDAVKKAGIEINAKTNLQQLYLKLKEDIAQYQKNVDAAGKEGNPLMEGKIQVAEEVIFHLDTLSDAINAPNVIGIEKAKTVQELVSLDVKLLAKLTGLTEKQSQEILDSEQYISMVNGTDRSQSKASTLEAFYYSGQANKSYDSNGVESVNKHKYYTLLYKLVGDGSSDLNLESFLDKYYHGFNKGGKQYSGIITLSNAWGRSDFGDLPAPNFRNENDNTISSIHLESHFQQANENIIKEERFSGNRFVEHSKNNKKVVVQRVSGINNSSSEKSGEASELTSEDITFLSLKEFNDAENNAYMQIVDQFADKSHLIMVQVPKVSLEQGKKEWRELVGYNTATGKEKLRLEQLEKTMLDEMFKQSRRSVALGFLDDNRSFSDAFAYNYYLNKLATDEVYAGQFKDYVTLSKRGNQVVSPGMAPVLGIEGGINKTINAVIYNDPMVTASVKNLVKNILPKTEIEGGDGFRFISEKHNAQHAVSFGSLLNLGKGIVKASFSDNTPEGRAILKSNAIVLTKKMVDMASKDGSTILNQIYEQLNNDNYPVDTIAFESSAKAMPKKYINKVEYKMKKGEAATISTLPFKPVVFPMNAKNYFVQVDLTDSSKGGKTKNMPVQLFRMLQEFPSFDKTNGIADALHNVYLENKKELDELFDGFSDNDDSKWKSTLLSYLPKSANPELRKLLNNPNIRKEHPVIQAAQKNLIKNMFNRTIYQKSSLVKKVIEAPPLGFPELRQKSLAVVNGKKVVILPQCYISHDMAKNTVRKKDHNGVEREYVIVTRTPITGPHSVDILEVKGFLPQEMSSTIITDRGTQVKAGADNDGDARSVLTKFQQKTIKGKKDLVKAPDGTIKEVSEKDSIQPLTNAERAYNNVWDAIYDEWINPEAFKYINAPVDTEFLDTDIKKADAAYPESKVSDDLTSGLFTDFLRVRENNSQAKEGISYSATARAGFQYMHKHKIGPAASTITLRGKKYANKAKGINFGLAKDVYEEAMILMGNISNVIVDNAKLQKMKKLGLYKETVTPYFIMTGFYGVSSTEATLFLRSPAFQDYIKMLYEAQTVISTEEEGKILENYLEQALTKAKVNALRESYEGNSWKSLDPYTVEGLSKEESEALAVYQLMKIARSYTNVTALFTATEKPVADYRDFVRLKQTLDNFLNDTGDVVYQGKDKNPFGKKAIDKNGNVIINENTYPNGVEIGSEHSSFAPMYDMLNKMQQFFETSIYSSNTIKEVQQSLVDITKSIYGRKAKMTYDQISLINKIVDNIVLEKIFDQVSVEELKENAVDLFNAKIKDTPAGEFLVHDKVNNQIVISTEFKRGLQESEVKEGRDELAKVLTIDEQLELMHYHTQVFGESNSNNGGGFFQLFSIKAQEEYSELKKAVIDEINSSLNIKADIDNVIKQFPDVVPSNEKFTVKQVNDFTNGKKDVVTTLFENKKKAEVTVNSPLYVRQWDENKKQYIIYKKTTTVGNDQKAIYGYELFHVPSDKREKYQLLNNQEKSKPSKIGFDIKGLSPQNNSKDAKKATIATDMIGYGRDTATRKSTTVKYQNAAVEQGIPLNSGNYNKGTVAFISVSGNNVATQEDIDNTVAMAVKVLNAGGSIVMDNKANRETNWNKSGEGEVFKKIAKIVGVKNIENISSDTDYVQVKLTNVKYQLENVDNEQLASVDPELQEQMQEALSELFPGIKVFSDILEFQDYVDKYHNGELVDTTAFGAAIGNAVFIDPIKAVQSTRVHEHSHIYWRILPNNSSVKKKLIEVFGTEEAAIQVLGRLGTERFETVVRGSIAKNVKRYLAEFWSKVKRAIGLMNEEDAKRLFVSELWGKVKTAEEMNKVQQDDTLRYQLGASFGNTANTTAQAEKLFADYRASIQFADEVKIELEFETIEDFRDYVKANASKIKDDSTNTEFGKEITYKLQGTWKAKITFLHHYTVNGDNKSFTSQSAVRAVVDGIENSFRDINFKQEMDNESSISYDERARNIGTPVHKAIELVSSSNLGTREERINDAIDRVTNDKDHKLAKTDLKKFKKLLEDVDDMLEGLMKKHNATVRLHEQSLYSEEYKYTGTIDVAILGGDGNIYIYDFKTSEIKTTKAGEKVAIDLKEYMKPSNNKRKGHIAQQTMYAIAVGENKMGANSPQPGNIVYGGIIPIGYSVPSATVRGSGPLEATDWLVQEPITFAIGESEKQMVRENILDAYEGIIEKNMNFDTMSVLNEQDYNKQIAFVTDNRYNTWQKALKAKYNTEKARASAVNERRKKSPTGKSIGKAIDLEHFIGIPGTVNAFGYEATITQEQYDFAYGVGDAKAVSEYNKYKQLERKYEKYQGHLKKVHKLMQQDFDSEYMTYQKLLRIHQDLMMYDNAAYNSQIRKLNDLIVQKLAIASLKDAPSVMLDINSIDTWFMANNDINDKHPYLQNAFTKLTTQLRVMSVETKQILEQSDKLANAVVAAKRKSMGLRGRALSYIWNNEDFFDNMYDDANKTFKLSTDKTLTPEEKAYAQWIEKFIDSPMVREVLTKSKTIGNGLYTLHIPESRYESFKRGKNEAKQLKGWNDTPINRIKYGVYQAYKNFIGQTAYLDDVNMHVKNPITGSMEILSLSQYEKKLFDPSLKMNQAAKMVLLNKAVKKARELRQNGVNEFINPLTGLVDLDPMGGNELASSFKMVEGQFVKQNVKNNKRRLDKEMKVRSGWHYEYGKNRPYSKNIHKAASTLIRDMMFEAYMNGNSSVPHPEKAGYTKSVEPIIPTMLATQGKYQEASSAGNVELKNAMKFIEGQLDQHIFGAQHEFLGKQFDGVLRGFVKLTHQTVIAFNPKIAVVNLMQGMLNNIIFLGGRRTLIGLNRFFNPMYYRKSRNLMEKVFQANDMETEGLKENTFSSLFTRAAGAMMLGAETIIRESMFLGMMTKKEFEAYEKSGMIKSAQDTVGKERMVKIVDRINRVQSKTGHINTRLYSSETLGQALGVFKRWIIDYLKLFLSNESTITMTWEDENGVKQTSVDTTKGLLNTLFSKASLSRENWIKAITTPTAELEETNNINVKNLKSVIKLACVVAVLKSLGGLGYDDDDNDGHDDSTGMSYLDYNAWKKAALSLADDFTDMTDFTFVNFLMANPIARTAENIVRVITLGAQTITGNEKARYQGNTAKGKDGELKFFDAALRVVPYNNLYRSLDGVNERLTGNSVFGNADYKPKPRKNKEENQD